MRLSVIDILILWALAAAPARAALEFSGYASTGDAMRFVLADPAAERASDWLALGDVFACFTVVEFDAKEEVLAVEKAGVRTPLALPRARVRPTEGATAASQWPTAPAAAGVRPRGSVQARYATGLDLLKSLQQDVRQAVVLQQRGVTVSIKSDGRRAEEAARLRPRASGAGRAGRTSPAEQGTANAAPKEEAKP